MNECYVVLLYKHGLARIHGCYLDFEDALKAAEEIDGYYYQSTINLKSLE